MSSMHLLLQQGRRNQVVRPVLSVCFEETAWACITHWPVLHLHV